MPNTSLQVGFRITAALDYVEQSDDNELRPHYIHKVCEMLADIGAIDKLSTAELASLVALLIPAHSRALTNRVGAADEPDGHRVLRLVMPHSQSPAQLG